ncbi:hypothetical protein E4U43_005795 [Claviceps pusilla]|uniref:Uncharacterized protein n=1 Tax=Claviceps pusilla TaxID=123648 RepID=A0A9P7SV97_9HYPO|nr:hypothetical protein E4U43_005795 [Claviceps pusilla]
MPCCLARLRYSRCSHIRLLKLGCTGDECADGDICPTTNQRMLLAANYRWSCEDCLHRAFAAEDAAHQALEDDEDGSGSGSGSDEGKKLSRAGQLERTIRTLQRRQVDEASRRSMIEALRMRNNHFRRMMLERRAAQVEEAQRVEEWVSNYGSGVFEYLYPWHGQDELPGKETGRGQKDEHEKEAPDPAPTQEQPGQDPQDEDRDRDTAGGGGSDTDSVSDDDDDDMDELDEASTPSVKERRTPEQSTMWLNLLLKTKHADMSICRDASGLYQKSRKSQKKACQCRGSRPVL